MASHSETPSKNVVILGAGGHASSVSDVLQRIGFVVLGYSGGSCDPVFSSVSFSDDEDALSHAWQSQARAFVAIGDNLIRRRLIEQIPFELRLAAAVAHSASVSASSELAEMSIVMEQAHVGPHARIGQGAIVNTAAVVEHHCVVGKAAHLAPGAILLGGAVAGPGSLIGSGACVLPGLEVGADATVGAGAVVTQNIPAGATVTGVPAREETGNRG